MPEQKSSFWTTLPGILTGVGGVLGATATILALVLGGGDGDGGADAAGIVSPPPEERALADWVVDANEICAQAYDDIRALGIPADANSQFAAIPQTSRIVTRSNQKLQALERPADGSDKVDKVLELASRANTAIRKAHATWTAGDAQTAETFVADYNALLVELQSLEAEIGANVCAEGA